MVPLHPSQGVTQDVASPPQVMANIAKEGFVEVSNHLDAQEVTGTYPMVEV